MEAAIQIGDEVEFRLDTKFGEMEGWYRGIVFRIEPYSEHRSFYWVKLDDVSRAVLKIGEISIFNPKNIRRKVNQ
ncbi:MAG: hypothetical protein FJ031_10330 [Chloroflexi bacterium]|jgi:hypothetical protein|nr:hypothetical protein [Chloroflexota bacterium]